MECRPRRFARQPGLIHQAIQQTSGDYSISMPGGFLLSGPFAAGAQAQRKGFGFFQPFGKRLNIACLR